jgi:uncharacterized protein (TIRG00374 family)
MNNNDPRIDYKKVIFLVIGIIILSLMIYRIGARNIAELIYDLLSTKPGVLLFCASVFLTANIIRLIRWSVLFRETSPENAFKIWLIGQSVNEVAPFGTGEITRAYIGKKYLGVRVRKTLIAIVIERTSDITFLGAMAVACAVLVLSGISIYPIIIIIFILLAFVYSILYYPGNLEYFRPLINIFKGRSFSIAKKIGERGDYWLTSLKNSLIKQKKRRYVLLTSTVLTVLIWSIEALGYFALFDALGYNIDYYNVLIVISASWILGVLSFLPGGIGARELTFATLMNTFGVPMAESATIALIYRGIAYTILGFGAFGSVVTLPKKSKKQSEK